MSRIDLSNVNISLKQFNDISSGVHNAGEVKLTSETAICKVNNHVTKNDETGAVTIRYSEPMGFPFKFSWETTVALDGTSTTTPVAVDAA